MNQELEKAPPREQWRDPADIMIAMVIMGPGINRMEAFEHEGVLWLAPQWIEFPRQGWMRPARIVSLEAIAHQYMPNASDYQVVVNTRLPEDMAPPAAPLKTAEMALVVDLPEIWFARPNVQ